MKTSFFPLLFAFMALFSFASCDDDQDNRIINIDDTPVEIEDYVATHFPDNAILNVTKEVGNREGVSFEATLEGNIFLDFNERKEITEIESAAGLPDSVIPAPIRTYVTDNYPDRTITGWELDNNEQSVELGTDLELVFDTNGNFLRIDN